MVSKIDFIIDNIDKILKTDENYEQYINKFSNFLEIYEKYNDKIDLIKNVYSKLLKHKNFYIPLEFKLNQINHYIDTYKTNGSKSDRMKHYLGLFITPFEDHTEEELNDVYDYFNHPIENRLTMEEIKKFTMNYKKA